jgi:hypothetical protein
MVSVKPVNSMRLAPMTRTRRNWRPSECSDFVAGFGFDVLDLAAVAIAVEGDDDNGHSGGRKHVENGGLVARSQFGATAFMLGALCLPVRQ